MAYCVEADLDLMYGSIRITQVSVAANASSAARDSTAITRAIERADNIIDHKIGSVYTVPISPTPGFLRDVSAELAYIFLYDRHQGAFQAMRDRFLEIMGMLDEIGAGDRTIPDVTTPDVLDPENTTNDGRQPVFRKSHFDETGETTDDDDYAKVLDLWDPLG